MSQSKIAVESVGQYPLTSRQSDPSGMARSPEARRCIGTPHQGRIARRVPQGLRLTMWWNGTRRYAPDLLTARRTATVGFQEVLPPLPVPLTVQELAL